MRPLAWSSYKKENKIRHDKSRIPSNLVLRARSTYGGDLDLETGEIDLRKTIPSALVVGNWRKIIPSALGVENLRKIIPSALVMEC